MGCEHSTADDLFLHVRGGLGDEGRRAVEAHLPECPSCQERLQTLRWIQEQVEVWGASLFADHIGSEELVRYAECGQASSRDRLRELERHLELCESCRVDLRTVEEVGVSLDAFPAREAPSWWAHLRSFLGPAFRPAPAWALALLLVLLLPAGWGIRVWLEGEPRSLDTLRSLPAPQILEADGERGTAAPPVLRMPEGGALVVEIHLPILDVEGVRYDARLEDAAGESVWERGDLRSIDGFGTFLLLLEDSRLAPGAYRLVVSERRAEQEAERFLFPFRLQTD